MRPLCCLAFFVAVPLFAASEENLPPDFYDARPSVQLFKAYAEAQYALGVMLSTGVGVAQNRAQSRYWFEQAAAQGHPGATRALEEDGGD
ncbi:SEL1-like repeat protein [Marinobacterium litorale]|uniref:SEL1-like repeat protein n=1 Tax=Marinobacterium litorale TaxID=404770 RepID=UPI00041482A2|nr:SEL1-like repeat protein [Marinobacterium litorale]